MVLAFAAALMISASPPGLAPLQRHDGATQMQPMDEQSFWTIIDRTAIYEADPARQIDALRAELEHLSADEVVAFRNLFEVQLKRAYTWDHWAVTYVVHGGASDDGFEYFRRWMVSKGHAVFEHLLVHPDDLADMVVADVDGVLEFEGILYVTNDVWSEKTGQDAAEMPMNLDLMTMGLEPLGEPFVDDPAHLERRLPKTWARFGNDPLY